MGELAIIYAVVFGGALVLQFLLYKGGNKGTNNTIFLLNLALVVIIGLINYSSQPSNYVLQKVISIAWIVLGALAFFLKSKGKESVGTSKILLTIALIGGIIQMIL